MVAGFIVAALSGGWASVKAILASMVKWRVHPAWYLVAFGLPFGAQLASILINPLFGSAAPAWSNIPAMSEMLPIIALYAVFSGPLGEEPGWRGFATPRLLASHSALTGSLILGVIWAIWHFPLGLVGDLSLYGTINVVLAGVVFTWLYQNTGSVLLAIHHACHAPEQRALPGQGVHRRRLCAAAMDRRCDLGGRSRLPSSPLRLGKFCPPTKGRTCRRRRSLSSPSMIAAPESGAAFHRRTSQRGP